MKTKFLLFLVSMSLSFVKSQVGINTQDPQATLDVNGNAIIRAVNLLPDTEPLDKILVLNGNNVISRTDLNRILPNNTIVKGIGGSGFSILSTSLISGWQKVSFPTIEIDLGIDYSTSNQEFIAPEKGMYAVFFSIEMASVISVSTLGAGILKTDVVSGITTLLAEESFPNISVLSINVTPPTRKTQTLVRLNQGDLITFGMRVPLANIGALANSKAQFNLWRIK